jgi:glycosyltransferase involved in cell wall biosynthesis
VKIAWFSPMPPSRSGIAAYSSEILPLLGRRGHTVDAFVDRACAKEDARVCSAHDFVWKHRREPYALTVFQLGNASCHDYMWAYLFRYPGLVVLHDAQLHQARALSLTYFQVRRQDYLTEFRANHPDAPAEVGDLVAAGLGDSLYQVWPHIRLVIESARLTVVHNARVRDQLAERYQTAAIDAIQMGVADPLTLQRNVHDARRNVGARCNLPADAIVVTVFGGVTPEKRIGPLMRALAAASERHPRLHLLIVGEQAAHYDVMADAAAAGISDRVHITGYVSESDVPAYLAAADICACLRWPTNRETSASWLRCLAAGKPTLVTDLTHLVDVPALDPQSWQPRIAAAGDPVAVSIDIVDEEHSLQLALDRLAADEPSRARLGQAARAWWKAHHRLDSMADQYERVIARAASLATPRRALPPHLTDDGTEVAHRLAGAMGVAPAVADLLG